MLHDEGLPGFNLHSVCLSVLNGKIEPQALEGMALKDINPNTSKAAAWLIAAAAISARTVSAPSTAPGISCAAPHTLLTLSISNSAL